MSTTTSRRSYVRAMEVVVLGVAALSLDTVARAKAAAIASVGTLCNLKPDMTYCHIGRMWVSVSLFSIGTTQGASVFAPSSTMPAAFGE